MDDRANPDAVFEAVAAPGGGTHLSLLRRGSLRARHSPLADPAEQLRLLAELDLEGGDGGRAEFTSMVSPRSGPTLEPATLEIFQMNLGKLCNMSCRHCHVDAGPDRGSEMMSNATIAACLDALDRSGAHTVDLTGGAPELHPRFRELVDAVAGRGLHVIDRCNLTILLAGGYRNLPGWLAERGVEIVSSLPHQRQRNTDAQRGEGVFERSIEALRKLNAAGYGKGDPRRRLTLMANPVGAFLAGNQGQLESEWRQALKREHGVSFDGLTTLNNMPISRFLDWLVESDNLMGYMRRLVDGFNPATVAGLMCRNTLSVSWDGRVFDCDFNQMLEMESACGNGRGARIEDFDPVAWQERDIRTARHCFGCTAGAGSSCGGAIVE
jgi:radical SAM/Cys-rich protein